MDQKSSTGRVTSSKDMDLGRPVISEIESTSFRQHSPKRQDFIKRATFTTNEPEVSNVDNIQHEFLEAF